MFAIKVYNKFPSYISSQEMVFSVELSRQVKKEAEAKINLEYLVGKFIFHKEKKNA